MFNYTLWVSGRTAQCYLIEGEQKNPNNWFDNICLNPFDKMYNKRKVNYKQLTINEFNNIINKYNLGNNWNPGDYDIFETEDRLF